MSFFDDASLVMIPSGYKDQKVYSVKPLDGSGDLTFARASNATRVASNGLIEKVRTNLILQSNTFSNASWIKGTAGTGVSVTSGQSGYDGTSDAWLLAKNLANEALSQSISYSDLATFSVYAKAGTTDWVRIGIGGGTFSSAYFDLTNGVVGATTTNIVSASIVAISSGWYRCSIVTNKSANAIYVYPAEGDNDTSAASGNILIQAAQLEAGDIATDYIATTSAAVSVGPVSGLPRLDYLNSSCPRLLLEGQRTNVITNYNDFVTGASNVTTTANNATSPEGYQNADLITGDAGTATKVVNFNGASAGQYTISVFAKYNTQQWIQLTAGGIATYANFDIQNGAVGGTNGTATITDYGNGWYRCSLLLASGTPLSFVVGIVTASGSARLSTTASTGSFWAYGYQSELGTYDTSLIPTYGTSVTRVADAASKTGISSLIGQTEGTLYWEGVRPEGGTDFSAFGVSDGTTNNEVYFRFTAADTVEFYVRSGGGQTVGFTYTGADLNQNTKIAFAYKANDVSVYVNGVQALADSSVTVPVSLTKLNFSRGNDTLPMIASVGQALLFKTRLSNTALAELTTL